MTAATQQTEKGAVVMAALKRIISILILRDVIV